MKKIICIIVCAVLFSLNVSVFAKAIILDSNEEIIVTEDELNQLIDNANRGKTKIRIPKDEDYNCIFEDTNPDELNSFFYEEDVQNARSLFSDDDLMEMYTAPS